MERILGRRNRALLRDLRALRETLMVAAIPPELVAYRVRLVAFCRDLEEVAEGNLAALGLGRPELVEDVLSDTQRATHRASMLSALRATPVLRAAPSDRLCLALLGWLHAQHPETADFPPALSDGPCGIMTFQLVAPLYYFPSFEQRGLRYLPLLLHEFGHFLYRRHQPELDDLVGELQGRVEAKLLPASRRNDRYAAGQATQRQEIVNTWYRWAQEFFCDAVGFVLGGPCFLHAFGEYIGTLDPADFAQDPTALAAGEHPISALRVRFLTERATKAGYLATARAIQDDWRAIARALGVREDHHGYYADALEASVTATIDDMITEAGPRAHTASEAAGGGWEAGVDSPIRLLNWAWQVAEADPGGYPDWEARQIAAFLR